MSGSILTSSQTVGPFFHDALMRADAQRTQLVAPDTIGERVRIMGHVYDGDGLGVPDAMLEIWQANHYGRYNHPADGRDLPLDPTFHGFGRAATDAARQRLIAAYAHDVTQPEWALGWRWDIVLGGAVATPFEPERMAQL